MSIIAADESPATDGEVAIDELAATDDVIAADEPAVTDNVIAADGPAGAVPAETGAETQPEPRIASGTLILIPAEERLPPVQEQPAVASGDMAPREVAPNSIASRTAAPREVAPNGVTPGNTASGDVASRDTPPPRNVTPPVQTTETPAAYVPPSDFSPFQAPLISSLEKGKWYVQLGVYSRPDNVEDEISRIGSAYPLAIQNIGTDTKPMFRVLLGPLNQGESGAMLQRFKSIGYADAFVRHN